MVLWVQTASFVCWNIIRKLFFFFLCYSFWQCNETGNEKSFRKFFNWIEEIKKGTFYFWWRNYCKLLWLLQIVCNLFKNKIFFWIRKFVIEFLKEKEIANKKNGKQKREKVTMEIHHETTSIVDVFYECWLLDLFDWSCWTFLFFC